MSQPKYLKTGDTITIISTARKISLEELTPAINVFKSWGLVVKFGKNLFQTHHQFAGTAEQRIADLQEALDDSESKAIVCARGGYGTVQLIDAIDFSTFEKNETLKIFEILKELNPKYNDLRIVFIKKDIIHIKNYD